MPDGAADATDDIARLRARLWEAGYRPVALYSNDKRPIGGAWQARARRNPPEAAVVAPRPDALNTGILCDGLRAIDLDIDDAALADRLEAMAVGLCGPAPVRWRDNSGRRLLIYRAAEGEPPKRSIVGTGGKIEVLGRGQQFHAFGRHPSGAEVRWRPERLGAVAREALPAVTEPAVATFLDAVAPLIGADPPRRRGARAGKAEGRRERPEARAAAAELRGVLARIPNDGPPDWEKFNLIGLAVFAASGGSDEGLAVFREWGAEHPDYVKDEVEGRWRNYHRSPPDKVGMHTLRRLARGARDGARPTIRVVAGDIVDVVDQAEAALVAAELGIYQRGQFVVRPGLARIAVSNDRTAIAQRLFTVGEHALLEAMTDAARWEKFDGRSEDWVQTDAPMKVVMVYLDRVGRWRLPVLTGIVNAPTLRPDGSVLAEPGYDPATGLLFDPQGASFPPLPERPTRADAERALATLRGLIATFPFVTPADRAVALSAILTACVRRSLPTAPMHGFSAPAAGTGKSMLVDLASAIATGREAAVLAQGKAEEECEKRLGALLLAGEAAIAIDNCEAALGGEFLCQMLTQSMVRARILGRSEVPELPTNAFVTATGNNLTLAGDLTRRALLCRLDAQCERPELRQFDRDAVAEAKANRGRYLVAALTVVRAFVVAGRPAQRAPLGSFVEWSRLVRDALVWLGEADPVATLEEARASDPQLANLTAVVEQWARIVGDERTTVRDLIAAAAHTTTSLNGGRPEFVHPDFREALLTVAGEGGVINSRRLGKWLAKNQGRVVAGRRIAQAGLFAGAMTWRLEAEKAAEQRETEEATEEATDQRDPRSGGFGGLGGFQTATPREVSDAEAHTNTHTPTDDSFYRTAPRNTPSPPNPPERRPHEFADGAQGGGAWYRETL